MAELVSAEIRQNWNELTYDPIVVEMAKAFAEGVELGEITMSELPSLATWANQVYRDAGGKVELLTLGAVVQAIRLILTTE